MGRHLTPVEVCERAFSNIEVLAQIIGRDSKTGYGWRRPSKFADAGDFRSMRHVRALHIHALQNNIPLKLEHLIYGASEDEVAALLAAAPPLPPARVEAAE
jgi:hypothetical protein